MPLKVHFSASAIKYFIENGQVFGRSPKNIMLHRNTLILLIVVVADKLAKTFVERKTRPNMPPFCVKRALLSISLMQLHL